ncbi:MAG TPA: hypothetical protein VFG72_01540 [Marmoricola sp.]|nr:hypothetical protein [Marmoricola sp.]
MLPTCDLATLVDRIREIGGAAPTVVIEGEAFARTELLADCLNDRIPGATVLSDCGNPAVRIWMEDAGGFHAHFLRARAEGSWVPGTWVATTSPEQQAALEAREAEDRRRRERADLVFVGLDHFDSVIELRFYADVGCDFALWDDHGSAGEIEELLPISADLRRRIKQWAVDADLRWTTGTAAAGRALAEELQQRLGPAYRIVYGY